MVLSLLGAPNEVKLQISDLTNRQRTRQPTSPRAAADERAARARRASAPQAGDEGSSGSTKDRQRRRTFVGTRSGEPSRDCLHTGQAGRPWPDRSAPACGTRGSIGATARGRGPASPGGWRCRALGEHRKVGRAPRDLRDEVSAALSDHLARAMQRRLDEEIRP